MEVEIKEPKEWQRVLEIKLPSSQIKEKLEKLYTKYKNSVQINGFRKGKVPMSMIKARFGATIMAEAKDEAINEACRKVLKENGIKPITQGKVTDVKWDEEDGLSFKASFEIMPNVEVKNYKGMELKVPSSKVKKEEVDAALNQLREQNATYVTTIRGAIEGDYIITDYEVLGEKKGIVRKERVQNYTITLGDKNLPDEFTTALLGAKIGDVRKTSIRYPLDYPDESLRGKYLEYVFYVKEIKEKRLPPLDEEFAKDMGINSLKELKKSLEKEIESQKKEQINRSLRAKVVDKLIEENPFEPPESLVNVYMEDIMQSVRGAEKLDNAAKEKLRELALWRAKRDILLSKVADKEDISVSRDEIEKVKKENVFKGNTEDLEEILRIEKALDFIIRNASIKEEVE